jgi:hypothetical protein
MTPSDLITELYSTGIRDFSSDVLMARLLVFLSDNLQQARTNDNIRLHDRSDFGVWLLQLADEVEKYSDQKRIPVKPAIYPHALARTVSDPCHVCGHIHKGPDSCGEDMGGAGKCGCGEKVTA